jgi:hypothetical protein
VDWDAESELEDEVGVDCAVSWIVVATCAAFAAGETEADEPALPLDVVAVDDAGIATCLRCEVDNCRTPTG